MTYRGGRRLSLSAVVAACSAMLVLAGLPAASDAADTLRPEVARALNDAQTLYHAHNYRGAMAKIAQAAAIPGKTPYEAIMVEQMQGAAASAAGDTDAAAKAYELLLESGQASGANTQQFSAALASIYFQQKNYAAAIRTAKRYEKAGGSDPQMRELLLQSYFLSGECAEVVNTLKASTGPVLQTGHAPEESRLQMLGTCAQKTQDEAAYRGALLALVAYYPKPSYQEDLFRSIRTKPGYLPALDIDVYRLRRATSTLRTVNDYMEMTQLSLVSGTPAEAKQVIDEGFASGVLGHDAQAERARRLRELVLKRLEGKSEGEPLTVDPVDAGLNLVFAGQVEQGLSAINVAITRGVAHVNVAQLRLAEAYYYAGQKARAVKAFRAVKGTDGSSDLASVWALIGKP
jgi:tetratricopeptide (TPR) repeat protein